MKATTEQSMPHERPSSAQLAQVAFQIQNPDHTGIRHPCPASSSTHPNLSHGQPAHPNFRQNWKGSSSVPPEQGKLSETSLKALGDTQRLSRLSYPTPLFCLGQDVNQQDLGFCPDQYSSTAGFAAPEFKPDSSFVNHRTFRPSQNASQTGPFSDILFSNDHRQSATDTQALNLKNQSTSGPIPGSSQANYQDDNLDFSDSDMVNMISSRVDYVPDPKKPRKRKITEKRREQNRAHQKAFRLRRDLFLKQKDLEISSLEERLDQSILANKEKHELIAKLKAQLRSVGNVREGGNLKDSVQAIARHHSPGEGKKYEARFESMNINEVPDGFPQGGFSQCAKDSFQFEKKQSNQVVPTDSSAVQWVHKSPEGGFPSMHHQSENSIFPWASTNPIYIPAQNMLNPNIQEEDPLNVKGYLPSYPKFK